MNDKTIAITRDDAVLLTALVEHAERRLADSVEEPGHGRRLPAAALNTTVEYEDVDSAARARVRLVHPADADAGRGRISVLSPVGRALLGRRPGHVAEVQLPSGDVRSLMIVAIAEEAGEEVPQ
jgi:transcription elongation GreA/GreB family factor